jgi:hypothetical protein
MDRQGPTFKAVDSPLRDAYSVLLKSMNYKLVLSHDLKKKAVNLY